MTDAINLHRGRKLRDDGETRRAEIMAFVKDFWHEHSCSPTIREIARGVRITSTSVVSYHLDVLRDRGELKDMEWIGMMRNIVPSDIKIEFGNE